LKITMTTQQTSTTNYQRPSPPRRRRSAPANLADVRDDHRNLALNWLHDQGYIVGGRHDTAANAATREEQGCDGTALTLTRFCGGERGAWFPHEQWPTFLRYYAWDLQHAAHRTPQFFNQCLGSAAVVRLALDLDLEGPTPDTDAGIQRIVRACHAVVCRSFADTHVEAIVCRAPSARIDPVGVVFRTLRARKMRSRAELTNDVGAGNIVVEHAQTWAARVHDAHPATADAASFKTGIHVFWNVFVNAARATWLARAAQRRLLADMGPRPDGYNAWTSVVDTRPLERGTLRLLGSVKTMRCIICASWPAARDRCGACNGAGRVADERAYAPSFACSGPEASVRVFDDTSITAEVLQQCTLYCAASEATPSFSTTWDPAADAVGDETTHVTPRHARPSAIRPPGRPLPAASPVLHELEQFLRRNIHREYASIRVTRVWRYGTARCILVGVDSRYCQNVRREHRVSVFFLVHRGAIWQRCYCKCQSTKCRTYRSPSIPLPTTLMRSLEAAV
jgi:hypothetical protein